MSEVFNIARDKGKAMLHCCCGNQAIRHMQSDAEAFRLHNHLAPAHCNLISHRQCA